MRDSATKSDENYEKEVELTNGQIKQHQKNTEQRIQTPNNNCSSPPPPPSIGTTVLNGASLSAPSPTQFFPYASYSSGHIMHRPIPILQKADAAISSLINNLTTSSNNLNQIRASPTNQVNNKPANSGEILKTSENNKSSNIINKNVSSNNQNNNNNNNTSATLANKPACDLNELFKLQQQQQQLFSSLRSNSIISNSPLMFNHLNVNNGNNGNNNGNNNSNSCSGNGNFLSNYSSNSNGANVEKIYIKFFYLENQFINHHVFSLDVFKLSKYKPC